MNESKTYTAPIDNSMNSILIVDDTPQNIQILGTILKNEKYQVEFATNGMQAIKWIENKNFDLILLDVMMPGMTGFEVCEIIRNQKEMDDVPIIFLTAKADKDSVVAGFDIGAQDYVTKPFDAKELLARVRTQLELKHSKERLKLVNAWLEEKVKERTLELEESNRKLEDANEELLELDNQKAEFLNLISHEIRTPLNGIVGIWDLIQDELKNEELRDLIDVMGVSVERLEKFAKTALIITELRTHKKELNKSELNLGSFVSEMLTGSENELNARNIKANLALPGEDVMIMCNPELIRTCYKKIMGNAIRFSPEDSTIYISVYRENDLVSWTITDEGPGFNEKVLKNMFKLFTPGHQHTDKNEGLDMALVKLIMEAHHGDAIVSNTPGKGARVELVFPCT